MPLILSLESSSEVCSVCLHDGGDLLSIVESDEAFSHTRKITVFIEKCLSKVNRKFKDLDGIAVSNGPGSYTGLRVSSSTAKGLCYGLDIPLIAVDTLKAIAQNAASVYNKEALYIPMIDARRMEVYNAILSSDLEVIKETHNLILEQGVFDDYLSVGLPVVLCGTGVKKSAHLFTSESFISKPSRLSASFLVEEANQKYENSDFENLVAYEPYYYKAPMVTKSKKKPF